MASCVQESVITRLGHNWDITTGIEMNYPNMREYPRSIKLWTKEKRKKHHHTDKPINAYQ